MEPPPHPFCKNLNGLCTAKFSLIQYTKISLLVKLRYSLHTLLVGLKQTLILGEYLLRILVFG